MKVNRLVVTRKEEDIDIAEVTLLSKDEYLAAVGNIPKKDGWWWLRSPYSGYVNDIGFVINYGSLRGSNVDVRTVGVRPALRIRNLRSSNLNPGDKFEVAGYVWTVIAEDMALCHDIVGHTCFRKNRNAKDTNDYEASDVKKWVENWAEENGIIVNAAPAST